MSNKRPLCRAFVGKHSLRSATQTLISESAERTRDARWFTRFFWLLAAAWLALRFYFNSRPDLVPDEAFYWTWTRHPATGYFDHPPMVAWLLWLSTRVLGNTAFAVRLPAALMSIGSLVVLYELARRILNDVRAVGFVVAMWLVGPLLAVTGTINTPDAPATFFSVCALACAVLIARLDDESIPGEGIPALSARKNPKWLWLAFGAFCGLAMLSKYTSVLVPAGVGLSLLISRAGRRHLAQPWVYLAAMLALLVFSPVIYWNATHRWASFLFQLHHGAGGELTDGLTGFFPKLMARLGGVCEFIGGQTLVWTPILFGLTIVVLAVNWRAVGRLRNVDRMLLWCGTLPLLFFGWAASRAHGELNWPAFAYFPLSLLIARYLSANWMGARVQWARKGCEVALAFSIALHLLAIPGLQQFLLRHHVPLPHQATDLWGWRSFGRQLAARADGLPVVCNRYGDAAEASFYMPGQPDIWCDSVGTRPAACEFFDSGPPDFAHMPVVIFEGGHVDLFMRKYGYTRETRLPVIKMPGLGKHRTRGVVRVTR